MTRFLFILIYRMLICVLDLPHMRSSLDKHLAGGVATNLGEKSVLYDITKGRCASQASWQSGVCEFRTGLTFSFRLKFHQLD